MQITDAFKNIDLSKFDVTNFEMPDFNGIEFDKLNERFEQLSQTAVANYTETNDRVLDAVVDTNRKVVDLAVKTATAVTERVDIRLGDRFPTPAEAGKSYIDFVERAAEINRDLNKRVVDMLPTPVKPSAAPAKATAKPAAKKAPAKKSGARKAAAKK